MVSVKAYMGFIELAAAVKFLSNADLVWSTGILTRPVFLVCCGGYHGGRGGLAMGWVATEGYGPRSLKHWPGSPRHWSIVVRDGIILRRWSARQVSGRDRGVSAA